MRYLAAALLIAAVMLGVAPFVSPSLPPAVAADPDEAVKARKAVLKEMGATMKELGRISKGDIEAERSSLIASAGTMKKLSGQPWGYFGQETSVSRIDNDAKSTIWADPAGFRKAQEDFIAAAADLHSVAEKGDAKTIGEKIAALGATCGACHKQFKD